MLALCKSVVSSGRFRTSISTVVYGEFKMEHADRAGHTALTKKLPEFISSSVCPEMLAGRLLACGIIGVATYEEARNTHSVESRRRGDLLHTVMGCGRSGAFQDFVHILLEMQACEWLGKKLIGIILYYVIVYLIRILLCVGIHLF